MRIPNVCVLIVAGTFAGSAVATDDGALTIQLNAVNGSGQTGTAKLIPEGETTKIVIEMANPRSGIAQPTRIHLGTCEELDPAAKWSLDAVKEGQSETVLSVPLKTILAQKAAINVHKSVIDSGVYVACGDLPAADRSETAEPAESKADRGEGAAPTGS